MSLLHLLSNSSKHQAIKFKKSTMAVTIPILIDLQINQFCPCEGCIRRVKTTLREVGGVELLSMDLDTGKLTISTAKHPQVIQFALQKKFKKVVDILPQEINRLFGFDTNVQDMAEALVKVSHAKGLESVEYRQSNTLKFNFNQPSSSSSRLPTATYHDVRGSNGVRITADDYEYVVPPPPPPTAEPSAPLIPTTQDQVTGYPADQFYGTFSKTSRNHHSHDCCTIL
ncbi:uncharacterized protein LOC112529366 [Cynara cardunculus var. scolymus]|uniref:Heavy metal-associated domain, HMA n=1 Tax=Cynara cardunculus var. scolymus TaxID=59895 RepID=A0A103YIK6_CYNCS|nr:uncharacterized protein LOC112529366 [Cynara cardunculus var. scolymus]KVI09791.1 Heavy metal-associated domain, HMA [Cynara cardunculus var. scolymus]